MTRTPLRVSLFGGGTDYPEYFERYPGAVVGMTIDKYIFISQLRLTAYQAYNYRVAYSKLEFAQTTDEIEHPVVREVLNYYKIRDRLDISILTDLPSGCGLGSSSAFTVGFLNVVNAMRGKAVTKIDLARRAIMFEREVLKENVGLQDQLHAAFGGINRFDFSSSGITIRPVQISAETEELLNASMVLVHTGIARRSTDTAAEQVHAIKMEAIDKPLSELYAMVGECVALLEKGGSNLLVELGRMLNESWKVKRLLSPKVSNGHVDSLFEALVSAGAHGSKLCGAGGGGFFLSLVPHDRIEALRRRVAPLAVIPVQMDVYGSTIVYRSERQV